MVVDYLRHSGWSVQSEPKHVVSDETLIPDIVAVRDQQAWVVDVRVCSDYTNRELQYFHEQKVRKYRRVDLVARLRLENPDVQIGDFSSGPVNWKGFVAADSARAPSSMGAPASLFARIAQRALA